MKIRLLLLLGAGMLFFAAGSVALSVAPVENKGAAEIKLAGGKRGLVAFPHHRHQDKLGDCDICHSVFPQEAGIKHVMNKLCTKCHKQRKKEGIKAGPTTCKKCHIKEKK
jgi:hypothetical protein